MQLPRRDRTILGASLAAAVCVPACAWWYLSARVQHGLVPALTELCATPVAIDHVEAGLTGTVRITGVEVGHVLSADAIEASVALDSLLAGELGADEIRIEHPRVLAQVDGAGDSDLARLIRRVAHARGGAASGEAKRRVRRIVVSDGALVVDVVGRGRLVAEDVELEPEPGGVRVVTGAVTATGALGPFAIDARFAHGAADVALPEPSIPRVLAVGGAIEVNAGGAPLVLDGATFARGVYGPSALTLVARAEDRGVPRPIELAALGGGGGAVRVEAVGVPLAALAPLAPRGVVLAGAHATGRVSIARAGTALRLDADVSLDGAAIDSRAVAEQSVPVAGRVAIGATVAGAVIDVDDATLSSGAIVAHARGRVTRGGPAGVRAGELDVSIDPAPCLALLESLPPQIRGPLDGMVLDGTAGGRGHLRWDLDAAPGEAVELAIDLDADRCVVTSEAPAADPHALAGAAEHVFPDGTRAVVGPGVGDWVALGDLPGHVDGAFRAAEDARFFEHHGFDPAQIARSLEVDLREGRFARGGSTISQQLAKNEWLSMRRTLDRKVQEAVLTWRLESVLPKRAILERYLNEIELGPHGVFGIGAAARWWFGKGAKDLDVKEAAFLAALTAEPKTMSARVAAAGGLDRESEERVTTVLRAMRRAGVIDKDELDRAKDARLAFRREALAPIAR